MKKQIIISAIALLATSLFSCNNEEELPRQAAEEGNARSVVNSRFRTLDEAIDIANSAMSMLDDDTQVISRSARSISMADTHIVTSPLTRSGETDTLLYILNFNNNAGYAVVSANRATEGLLAITDQGNYQGENSVNPAAQMFIDQAIAYSSNNNDSLPTFKQPDPSTGDELFQMKEVEIVDTFKISPRVRVKWGQKDIEGRFCPNGICGCVPTAIAMIMSVYRLPSTISLSYSGHDVSTVNFDWEAMKKHRNTERFYFGCDHNDENHLNISRLCRQLGEWGDAKYRSDSTGTSVSRSNITNICKKIGYTHSGWQNYNMTFQYNEPKLTAVNFFLMTGGEINEETGKTDYHAWVIDGCLHLHHTHYLYLSPGKTDIWTEYDKSSYDEYYLHCNWGWYGDSNGYFNHNLFKTSCVRFKDVLTTNYSRHNFTEKLEFLKIEPTIYAD